MYIYVPSTQNKWYPQRCLLAHFEDTFATAKIE